MLISNCFDIKIYTLLAMPKISATAFLPAANCQLAIDE